MEIRRVDPQDLGAARGTALVIDVIRAFTVAAYALNGGARRLWLVRTVDEALALRGRDPTVLLAGEVGGRLIPGFDLNNSPARMASASVSGRTIVQRTGAGTQAAVGADGAHRLLVCSLVNARATAHCASTLASTDGMISIIPSGWRNTPEAIEDNICADYLEALLCSRGSAGDVLEDGLRRLSQSGRLDVFAAGANDFPAEDVPAFMAVDRFPFAMEGTRHEWNGTRYVEVRRVDVTLDRPPDREGGA